MDKEIRTLEQSASNESKCPFTGKSSAPKNSSWWPNQLDVQILHQHSALSNPMGEEFDYAKEFKSLDLQAERLVIIVPALSNLTRRKCQFSTRTKLSNAMGKGAGKNRKCVFRYCTIL